MYTVQVAITTKIYLIWSKRQSFYFAFFMRIGLNWWKPSVNESIPINPMQKQLLWFRQDLRIQDHTALWHAAQSGPLIALVILSPEQWRMHDDAPIKLDFYLRQIQAIQQELASIQIPLIIRTVPLWENIATEIDQLCQKLNIENFCFVEKK